MIYRGLCGSWIIVNSTLRRTESVWHHTRNDFTRGTLTVLTLHFHLDSTVVVCWHSRALTCFSHFSWVQTVQVHRNLDPKYAYIMNLISLPIIFTTVDGEKLTGPAVLNMHSRIDCLCFRPCQHDAELNIWQLAQLYLHVFKKPWSNLRLLIPGSARDQPLRPGI